MNTPLQPEITVHMPQHVFEQIKEEQYTLGFSAGYHEGYKEAKDRYNPNREIMEITSKEKVDGTETPTYS